MKSPFSRSTALVLGPLFVILFGALLYLQETSPDGSLRSIEGAIVNRTPIETKGKLTGFRVCVGPQPMTFTYSDPDPRVEHVWRVIGNADRALVQYTDRPGRNPVLWGLEANGEVLATAGELQQVRRARYYLYVAGFVISGAIFAASAVGSLKSRKLRVRAPTT